MAGRQGKKGPEDNRRASNQQQTIMDTIIAVFTNKIFYATLIAWVSSQTLKVIIHYIQYRKIDLSLFSETGGMPSAHSATVSALSSMVGFEVGWTSPLFMVCLTFSLIVMYDAAGLRRAAGEQAKILNRIILDVYSRRRLQSKRLKELVGHTPVEVMAGCVFGILLAIICS